MSIMAGDRDLNALATPPSIHFDPCVIGSGRHAAIDGAPIRDQKK